ncbi:MAG TPA: hypothetical protein VGY48_15550 [Vicinamibacterales bacterium]|jgi:ferredoxin|nr:hypothetical protein [Vicinamibacterales bacterium]
MSRVRVEVDEVVLQGDYGDVDGIEVKCVRCGHCVEVFGTGDASIKRGCAMLRDECPEKERNFYVE